MARPLTRPALTLFAGLALLGTVVACGGRSSVPATPHRAADLGSQKVAAAGSITTTTYQNIAPLTFYTDGSILDFLITPVSVAAPLTPLNTGTLATSPLTIPVSCTAGSGGVVALAVADRRSAVAASPTPPPTAAPTNLPVSSCIVVAYANGANPVPVTGYGSIDGSNLIFGSLVPGPTYQLGVTYTFYIAYATTVTSTATPAPTATPSPTPGPTSTPGCDSHHDNGHRDRDNRNHNGRDDGRHEHDNGNHKDCGYHNGDDHDRHDHR